MTSVAQAIDDCDVTFALIEKSSNFDNEKIVLAKRFLSMYSLKLSLLTFTDISTSVDRIVNNLTREADALGNFLFGIFVRNLYLSTVIQILANRGTDSRFVPEANLKSL